ncbi:MAG: RtcB family protein [Myxococcota bacterium]
MSAPIHRWVTEPVPADVERALQRLADLDDAVHVAVMPDVHLAPGACVGTVLATSRTLFPPAVGGDVGCGVATLRLSGLSAGELDRPPVLAGLEARIPVLRHAKPPPWPDLDPDELSCEPLRRRALRDGRVQLGTVGRGNHFVEVQADDGDAIWVMAHSGSRAMGRAVQDHHGGEPIDAQRPEGLDYAADLAWAEAYAAHNRQRLLLAALRAIRDAHPTARPDPETYLDCAHNHVHRERQLDRDLWVHRKGAISARNGEPGLVPGSMGTWSYHVEGRGHPLALGSSSHGAGRTMTRTEARAAIGRRELRRQLRSVAYRDRPDLGEEAPSAYRDIGAVMRAQRELTRIVRRVRPLVVHKG